MINAEHILTILLPLIDRCVFVTVGSRIRCVQSRRESFRNGGSRFTTHRRSDESKCAGRVTLYLPRAVLPPPACARNAANGVSRHGKRRVAARAMAHKRCVHEHAIFTIAIILSLFYI